MVWPNHFSGPCPVAPASTFVGLLTGAYQSYPQIVAAVPFYDRTSWLFTNQDIEKARYNFKLCIEADPQKYGRQMFEIFIYNPHFGGDSWAYLSSEPSNETSNPNILMAEKRGKSLYPLPVLTESIGDIRIWIDDLFIILWTCIDINDFTRDEAVILLRHNNVPANITKFEDSIRLLKTFSKEYLSKELMNAISWPTKMNEEIHENYFPFKCRFENMQLNILGVVWLLVLLILGVALISVIIKRKKNIVRPL